MLQTIMLTARDGIKFLGELQDRLALADSPADATAGTVDMRWRELLDNLFPTSILIIDFMGPAPTGVAGLSATPDEETTIRRILTATASFLLAESLELQEHLDLWCSYADVADGERARLYALAERATADSSTLLDHADNGSWRTLAAGLSRRPTVALLVDQPSSLAPTELADPVRQPPAHEDRRVRTTHDRRTPLMRWWTSHMDDALKRYVPPAEGWPSHFEPWPHLFLIQSARTPLRLALATLGGPQSGPRLDWSTFETGSSTSASSTTYSSLDEASRALARHMCETARGALDEGAGSRRVVAVCLPWSRDLVVSLLAILRVGAAYALVDPALPANRVADVIRRIQPTLVVGDSRLLVRQQHLDIPGVAVDDWFVWLHPGVFDQTRPTTAVPPSATAVVDWHFGRDGTPEIRRLITHRELAEEVYASRDREAPVVAASVTHARLIHELYLPLVTGGTVLIPPETGTSAASGATGATAARAEARGPSLIGGLIRVLGDWGSTMRSILLLTVVVTAITVLVLVAGHSGTSFVPGMAVLLAGAALSTLGTLAARWFRLALVLRRTGVAMTVVPRAARPKLARTLVTSTTAEYESRGTG